MIASGKSPQSQAKTGLLNQISHVSLELDPTKVPRFHLEALRQPRLNLDLIKPFNPFQKQLFKIIRLNEASKLKIIFHFSA